jgi:hypothetical protein
VSEITLAQANAIIEAAFAKGKELGLKPVSFVCVCACDAGVCACV